MKVKSIVLGLFLVSSALVAGFGADNLAAGADNLAAGADNLAAGADEGVISPPAGSTFTFHVKNSGDKAATVSLWQEPGEHDEVHTYVGVVKNVMGKTKDKTIEGSEPYDCIKWAITRPDKPDFYANFCYAIENNVLYYYLEEQSSGELKYYVNPLKMISSPLKVGDKYSGNTSFYTNVPDTGVFLAKRYESPDVKRDSIKVDVSIDKKENISVGAETFECYKITTVFESHTGSFITAATGTITMERWWSPELGYCHTNLVKLHNA